MSDEEDTPQKRFEQALKAALRHRVECEVVDTLKLLAWLLALSAAGEDSDHGE